MTKGNMRLTTLVVLGISCVLLLTLFLSKDLVLAGHMDDSIEYVSSDGSNYWRNYELIVAGESMFEDPTVIYLVGSPIVALMLADGNLVLVQLFNLIVMSGTLFFALKYFTTFRGRLAFTTGALVFPYFLFGFLSLNKEIFAMCSAIFIACHITRPSRKALVFGILLAAMSRYYMLVAIIVLLFLVPRTGRLRYGRAILLLVVFSILAPVTKIIVPGYSYEDVLEGSGVFALLSARVIDAYGYAVIYPLKYIALILSRLYSFLIGLGRLADPMEALVSVLSLISMVCALYIVSTKKSASSVVKRLTFAGLVAPIPIMWSEIFHWRYYSFVYYFFLFAVILHFENSRAFQVRRQPIGVEHNA